MTCLPQVLHSEESVKTPGDHRYTECMQGLERWLEVKKALPVISEAQTSTLSMHSGMFTIPVTSSFRGISQFLRLPAFTHTHHTQHVYFIKS